MPVELLGLLRGKDVMVGAIDVATNAIERPEEVAKTLERVFEHVPVEHVVPCTNCGLVPLSRDVARAKLRALGAGVALVRGELGG